MKHPGLSWHEKLAYLAHRWAPVTDTPVEACPVKHDFSPGLYIREIFVPAGTIFIGRPHRTGHRIVGARGRVVLYINGERRDFDGPFELVTEPGTQIAAHAITDHVAYTYHDNPTDCRDVDECEAAAFTAANVVLQLGSIVDKRLRLKELECRA